MTQKRTQPTPTNHNATAATEQTLIDHLHELRARLFWIVLALVLASSGAYLIQDQIMAALMAPLGGQRLVYLTPIGGFSFIFKVSIYFGIGVILPAFIYHLYRFLEPIMDVKRKRSVALYIVASTILAAAGGSFAYFASLPAALHFLTGFSIHNVSAMLTVDSYLTFVITYVLGAAALFQIPLILMIINTIKPIPPSKLLGSERFIILGAFIAAAVISPTPDITNQAILAVPIIVMYQFGVLAVWLQSRALKRKQRKQMAPNRQPEYTHPAPMPVIRRQPAQSPAAAPALRSAAPAQRTLQTRTAMDISRPVRPVAASRQSPASRRAPTTSATMTRPRYIDGVAPRTQQVPQAS